MPRYWFYGSCESCNRAVSRRLQLQLPFTLQLDMQYKGCWTVCLLCLNSFHRNPRQRCSPSSHWSDLLGRTLTDGDWFNCRFEKHKISFTYLTLPFKIIMFFLGSHFFFLAQAFQYLYVYLFSIRFWVYKQWYRWESGVNQAKSSKPQPPNTCPVCDQGQFGSYLGY